METLWQDLRYALRGLRQSPGFTLAAVLTLGLGIGINAVTFGAIDAMLLRPPSGVGEPDGALRVEIRPSPPPGQPRLTSGDAGVTYPIFRVLRAAGAFAPLAAFSPAGVTIGSGGAAEKRAVIFASREYFSTLRVRPALGRLFTPGDEYGLPPSAVLSYAYWQSALGADPRVIGRTLLVDGHRVDVIGVAPPDFNGLDVEPVAGWLSFSAASLVRGRDWIGQGIGAWLHLVGRPAPGLSPAAAAGRLSVAITPGLIRYLDRDGRVPFADAVSLRQRYGPGGTNSPVPEWLLAVTAVVLLVACANVAGLLLARGARRRREIAVRVALGAGRARIVRQLLVETVLLALLGAALGLALTTWGSALVAFIGGPRLATLVDVRVLAFTAGVVLLTALAAGLAPALRASAVNVESTLRAGSGRTSPDRARARGMLTVAEVALSLALLVCAGLFVQSLRNASTIPLGFDPDGLLVVSPQLPAGAASEAERRELGVRAAERLRALPGVLGADRASMVPLHGFSFATVRADPQSKGAFTVVSSVGGDYFRTLGLPLLAGRAFDARDRADAPPTAIVNRSLARLLWHGASPIGRCLRPEGEDAPACLAVVGEVDDARTIDLLKDPPPQFYLPLSQRPVEAAWSTLLVRTRGQPADAIPAVRAALHSLDARVLYVDATPFRELLRPTLAPWRVAATLLSAAALLTLLLALTGVYGIIAYLAAERTHEVGIRIALGARPAEVQRLLLRQAGRLTFAGAALGVALALMAARLLRSRFFGVSPTEPWVYLGAALALAAAALAASYLPARRAARADPIEALRSE